MTAAVAPLFSERHPRAAAIFDVVHMMHDIISDILAADTVAQDRKREVIYAGHNEFQDPTLRVMSEEEWRMMGDIVGGSEALGGPLTALLSAAVGDWARTAPRHEHRP